MVWLWKIPRNGDDWCFLNKQFYIFKRVVVVYHSDQNNEYLIILFESNTRSIIQRRIKKRILFQQIVQNTSHRENVQGLYYCASMVGHIELELGSMAIAKNEIIKKSSAQIDRFSFRFFMRLAITITHISNGDKLFHSCFHVLSSCVLSVFIYLSPFWMHSLQVCFLPLVPWRDLFCFRWFIYTVWFLWCWNSDRR